MGTITDQPTYTGEAEATLPPGTRVMTPENRDELAVKLGKFILDQLPYGAEVAFPADIGQSPTSEIVTILPGYSEEDAGVQEIEMSGLYGDATAVNPYKPVGSVPSNGKIADDDLRAKGALRYWEMNGAHHQVTKAMRIWYTYQVPEMMENGRPAVRGTWLLVGYVGNGH